jgi:hypothetical protein
MSLLLNGAVMLGSSSAHGTLLLRDGRTSSTLIGDAEKVLVKYWVA